MVLNHLENIQICTAYHGTQILSIIENFLKFSHYNMHLSIDAMKQYLVIRFRIVLMLSVWKWWYSMLLFNCFKLSINLIPPLLLWDMKIGETNSFSAWQVSLITSLVRSLSISSLIKLISSSENLGDLALCILGASTNSILSPEIIGKMFGSFVSFLHCLHIVICLLTFSIFLNYFCKFCICKFLKVILCLSTTNF